MKYTISVSATITAQFSVEASTPEEAKSKALQMARESVEVTFAGEAISPDLDWQPIKDDAVEVQE